MNEFPRRNRLDKNTPAELAIRAAVDAVERAGADARLTRAVNLLHEARELVADVVDGLPPPETASKAILWDPLRPFARKP